MQYEIHKSLSENATLPVIKDDLNALVIVEIMTWIQLKKRMLFKLFP